MTRREMLELAGFIEANGKVGRIVEHGMLARPKWAGIEHGQIHWKDSAEASRSRLTYVKPPTDLLDRFVKLWEADDAAILEFARNYGTLRPPLLYFQTSRKSDYEAREPLVRWRTFRDMPGSCSILPPHCD